MPRKFTFTKKEMEVIRHLFDTVKKENNLTNESLSEILYTTPQSVKNWTRKERPVGPSRAIIHILALTSLSAFDIVKKNMLLGDDREIYDKIERTLKSEFVGCEPGVLSYKEYKKNYERMKEKNDVVIAFGLQNTLEGKSPTLEVIPEISGAIERLRERYVYFLPDPYEPDMERYFLPDPHEPDMDRKKESYLFGALFDEQKSKIIDLMGVDIIEKGEKIQKGLSGYRIPRKWGAGDTKTIELYVVQINFHEFIDYLIMKKLNLLNENKSDGESDQEFEIKKNRFKEYYLEVRDLLWLMTLLKRPLFYFIRPNDKDKRLYEGISLNDIRGINVELMSQSMKKVMDLFDELHDVIIEYKWGEKEASS